MSQSRTAIIRGPAKITWDPTGTPYKYYTQGDIVVRFDKSFFDIDTSQFGVVDQRLLDRVITIAFTPAGEWETDATALYPYAAKTNGTSILGATDKKLKIEPLSGKPITFANVALTKMPSLIFSATKTMIGPVEFQAIGANSDAANDEWNDAANMFVLDASATVSDFSDFNASNIRVRPYVCTWGTNGTPDGLSGLSANKFLNMSTLEGIMIDFPIVVSPFSVDNEGVIDFTFERLDVRAQFTPVGPIEDDFTKALNMQGTGVIRGMSNKAVKGDFLIHESPLAGVPVVAFTAYEMGLKSVDFQYSNRNSRFGAVELISTRKFSAGALQPWFQIPSP